MSEAYLFASAEAAAPDAALRELLRGAGARAGWLNEVHWVGQPLPTPPPGSPFYAWPEYPLLPLFCLQAALLKLESSAADLIAVGQSGAQGCAALLLGSPAAVGRWNLPPRARLQPLPIQAAGSALFVQAALLRAAALLPEEAHLALAAVRGVDETDLAVLPAGLTRLPDAGPALAQAARLAGELARAQQDFALLAEFSSQGGLAFLLERV